MSFGGSPGGSGSQLPHSALHQAWANVADHATERLEAGIDGMKGWHTLPSLREPIDRDTPFARPASSAMSLTPRADIPFRLPPGLMAIDTQAKKVLEVTSAPTDQGTSTEAVIERAQLTEKLADDLKQTAGSVLESPQLRDYPGIQTMHESANEILESVRNFVRAYEGTPVTLRVASSSHGQVQVTGLARFVRANTVHVQDSRSVVVGDNCSLRSVDHYHVRQVSMPLRLLLEQGSPARAALVDLAKDHSDAGIAKFQGKIQSLIEPPKQHDTEASLPVKENPAVIIRDSKGASAGDGSEVHSKINYVIECSEVSAIDILATSETFVRSFVDAAAEFEPGPVTDGFLRYALVAAGHVEDIALLDYGTDLQGPNTSVWALFGVDVVRDASAVMVGSGNELTTDMQVHRGGFAGGTIRDDLAEIRQLFAQAAPKARESIQVASPA